MATFLAAKAPTEVVQRRWLVPVDSDDSASSASLSASGITIDANSFEDNELVLTLSAGSAGATGSITATITTARSRTLVETLYIPVVTSASSASTVQDIINFALRKVYGLGETPPADAADHAVECLSDMLKQWKTSGADIGATFPLATSTVLYCPEDYLEAIKNNLIVGTADLFNREVSPMVLDVARRGLAHIKQKNLPAERDGASYY